MITVAVVGASAASTADEQTAYEIGGLVADAGWTLVCGGLDGVMSAACRGAAERGGLTIGLLPTDRRSDANPWVRVAIPTGMGEARNAIVARSADALIAIGGEFGTLSEIALALKIGVPVIGIGTWRFEREGVSIDPIARAANADEAVALVRRLATPG